MQMAFVLGCSPSSKSLAPFGPTVRASPSTSKWYMNAATGSPKKVAVVGAGWAGLGAAYHLSKQDGVEVTLIDAAPSVGGLVAGWKTDQGREVEVGVHGSWRCYYNVFQLVHKDLGLNPFSDWTRSSQRSPKGKVVESPVFAREPRLPMPAGTFIYTKFLDLPLVDRLSAIPLMKAVIEWDNSHEAWMRFDKITAKELFKQYGCSERVYKEAFEPMLLVGLFAPGEQCSASGALGMLYFFILAHQADFDVVWPRGTVARVIFDPWVERMKSLGTTIRTSTRLCDIVERNNTVEGIVVQSAAGVEETIDVDAVVFSVGISGLQRIVSSSKQLAARSEFRNTLNLSSIDVMAVRIYFDRKINIEFASNACFGFHETTGWTYFDLNSLHDEYRDSPKTVVEADFYHSNQMMPMDDNDVVNEVLKMLKVAEKSFEPAQVDDFVVVRVPRGVTHFRPGSYQHFMSAETSFKNLFMSGDWIKTFHGSFSQEKALVTGYEAANHVLDHLGFGKESHKDIIPVEQDEAHVVLARNTNRILTDLSKALNPFSEFFMM